MWSIYYLSAKILESGFSYVKQVFGNVVFIPNVWRSYIIYDRALNRLAPRSPSRKQIRAFTGRSPAV